MCARQHLAVQSSLNSSIVSYYWHTYTYIDIISSMLRSAAAAADAVACCYWWPCRLDFTAEKRRAQQAIWRRRDTVKPKPLICTTATTLTVTTEKTPTAHSDQSTWLFSCDLLLFYYIQESLFWNKFFSLIWERNLDRYRKCVAYNEVENNWCIDWQRFFNILNYCPSLHVYQRLYLLYNSLVGMFCRTNYCTTIRYDTIRQFNVDWKAVDVVNWVQHTWPQNKQKYESKNLKEKTNA